MASKERVEKPFEVADLQGASRGAPSSDGWRESGGAGRGCLCEVVTAHENKTTNYL
jgi:hypothetical protein